MNILPYQSQTSCRKASGVVSTSRGRSFYPASVPWSLLSPHAMRGVEAHLEVQPHFWSWPCGQWSSWVPKAPHPCRFGWVWLGSPAAHPGGRGLPSLAAGSGGDQNNASWFFPSIHGMNTPFTSPTSQFPPNPLMQSSSSPLPLSTPVYCPPSLISASCPRVGFMSAEPGSLSPSHCCCWLVHLKQNKVWSMLWIKLGHWKWLCRAGDLLN